MHNCSGQIKRPIASNWQHMPHVPCKCQLQSTSYQHIPTPSGMLMRWNARFQSMSYFKLAPQSGVVTTPSPLIHSLSNTVAFLRLDSSENLTQHIDLPNRYRNYPMCRVPHFITVFNSGMHNDELLKQPQAPERYFSRKTFTSSTKNVVSV